ncbi:MAG: class C sortase [Arachnia sp.]
MTPVRMPDLAPREGARPRAGRGLVVPLLLQLGAMLGLGALLYPQAADWFATQAHDAEVSGYVRQVQALPDAARQEALDRAYAYNATLPQGLLRDPYVVDTADGVDEGEYQDLLRVGNEDVIGQLAYPRLHVALPLYHGTSDHVLARGVGHLFGSSLPVGGPSTHAVLTSHSGLVNAALFSPLTRAEIGDTFYLEVLGESLHYRVDGIETVLPEETERLRIEPGEDRVTLFTCTPIGINSHRLLVHAVRVPAPDTTVGHALAGDGIEAGFPWWALWFGAASLAVAAFLVTPPRRRSAPTDSMGGGR